MAIFIVNSQQLCQKIVLNKMKKIILIAACITFANCNSQTQPSKNQKISMEKLDGNDPTPIKKTEQEWAKILSPEQYNILREKGTERPGTGKYNLTFDKGVYTCGACGYELFTSDMKFESHCGWPSFDKEIGNGSRVKKIVDRSLGMSRTEIVCARCNGHLGHIFDDGPTATGQRYCVNSLSIDFKEATTTQQDSKR
jgi:methionine-R-sulfoxide reductase